MQFPYGNDLNNPGSWAGLPNAKAENYMIAYHSGLAFGIGSHTFLFFGMESLCAFSATLLGGGLSVSYGLSDATKRVNRGGGQSNKYSLEFDVSESLKRIEKGKEIKDAYDWSTSLDDINSAHQIYKLLASNISTFNASIPFSANDLSGTGGVVSGVKADVLIGSASYYLADAAHLFTEAQAYNITKEATLLSASLGQLGGVWILEKPYNLWDEIAYSKKDE